LIANKSFQSSHAEKNRNTKTHQNLNKNTVTMESQSNFPSLTLWGGGLPFCGQFHTPPPKKKPRKKENPQNNKKINTKKWKKQQVK